MDNLFAVFDWQGYPARWVCAGGGRRVLVVQDPGDRFTPGGEEPIGEDVCPCPTCNPLAAPVAV